MNTLQVSELTKIYAHGSIGVRSLSFTVKPSEVYDLIDPNGSGKTTTSPYSSHATQAYFRRC